LVNKECGFALWQSSYNDRIIYNREEYQMALQYIEDNPKEWLKKHIP